VCWKQCLHTFPVGLTEVIAQLRRCAAVREHAFCHATEGTCARNHNNVNISFYFPSRVPWIRACQQFSTSGREPYFLDDMPQNGQTVVLPQS
jgi:hypothetical protein